MERQDPPATSGHEEAAERAQTPETRQPFQAVQPEQFPTAAQPSAGWGAPTAGQPSAGWGAPTAQQAAQTAASGVSPGKWSLKKELIAGGVAVVVAGATAAGVYAAGSGASTGAGAQGPGGITGQGGTTTQGGPGGFGMNGGGFAPNGLGMGAGGLAAAVHSEYVILRNGKYVNMASQTGTVTAVSDDSITVKSEDGFTRSYSLGSGLVVTQGMQRGMSQGSTLGISDVQSGATVRITALQESGNYTAETIQLVTGTSSVQGSGTGVPGGDPGTGASGNGGTGTSSN